jgi:hypothetical protein
MTLDTGQAPSTDAADVEQQKSYEISPLALGLVLVGAAVMIVSLFLPLGDSSNFIQVANNRMLQHSESWWIAVLAVIAAGMSYRAFKLKRLSWAAIICGLWALGMAIYMGKSDSLLQVCSVAVAYDCEKAGAGLGIYAAGLGGALTAFGGFVLRAAKPVSEGSDTSSLAVSLAELPATKTCPECAETILAAAKVCKHCSYRFEESE